MGKIGNWKGDEVEVATSKGGVYAVCNWEDNLISSGMPVWPPPELVQKTYKSRQERAFAPEDLSRLNKKLGYYCDLQSLHSEDAITWSVFGTMAYAPAENRLRYFNALMQLLKVDVEAKDPSVIWLWRRVPHPDNNCMGGPEIDFGFQSKNILVLGEAKWLSNTGSNQGVYKDQNQFQIREKFLCNSTFTSYDKLKLVILLGVSYHGGINLIIPNKLSGVDFISCDCTWKQIADIKEHILASEINDYYNWKELLIRKSAKEICPQKET